MNLEAITKQAIEVTKQAGAFIRNERKTFDYTKVEYKGFNDLVSFVDKTSEKILVEGLRKIIPPSGFITEEKTTEQNYAEYRWIIDPLDGTTNFVHGVPCFCVSVALLQNDELVIGIIYEVNLDECFYGWKKGGAFLNGNKISVSKIDSLKKSLLATGFPYSDYSRMQEYMKVFDVCMHQTHGLRRLGSAAADLAYVACGRFAGFYEYGLKAWDVAAGALLVKEAGGKVSDFNGGTNYLFGEEIITTNSLIFEEFLNIVKKEFSHQ